VSLLIDLEDTASLEKLGQALLKIPSFVTSFTDKIIKTPETRELLFNSPEFKTAVDTAIVLSDNKILPRLRSVEKVTGNYSFEPWEEHDPTITEQITELKDKISYFESARVILPANQEPEIKEDLLIQNTTLTQKANAIYEYLKQKVKPNWAGKTVIENEGIYSFFFEIIEEKLRWPDKLRGKRTAKKSIIERAVELHPHELELVKNKSGNKITGLALKPSLNRIGTYA
jgi:hypothetical protein